MGTLIVGVILGLIVFAIIRYLLKELKSGKVFAAEIALLAAADVDIVRPTNIGDAHGKYKQYTHNRHGS